MALLALIVVVIVGAVFGFQKCSFGRGGIGILVSYVIRVRQETEETDQHEAKKDNGQGRFLLGLRVLPFLGQALV